MHKPPRPLSESIAETATIRDADTDALATRVNSDDHVLKHALMQWQFGDWKSLMELDRAALYYHPDRCRLALLAAAGYMQDGNMALGRQMLELAREWGCSKHMMARILIAGVHNSLGRTLALNGNKAAAIASFEAALAVGAPEGEQRLLSKARAYQQLQQLGLGDEAGQALSK